MTLFALSYLAGVLTILAPCILPVVPFVFARVDQPFVRSGLPLLGGLALSFAAVATLATVGGAWAADANDWGRHAALALMAASGLALLMPSWAERWTRPLVALGARLGSSATSADNRDGGDATTRPTRTATAATPATAATTATAAKTRGAPAGRGRSVGGSFVLGVATGLLWAPCAGPVLGLVLATAALRGASVDTSLLLLAYAAGAATSLGAALWAGGRLLASMKRSLGIGDGLRRGLGAAVLAGVVAVAFGLDTRLLAKLPPLGGDAIEQSLLDRFGAPSAAASGQAQAAPRPAGPAPAAPTPTPKQVGGTADRPDSEPRSSSLPDARLAALDAPAAAVRPVVQRLVPVADTKPAAALPVEGSLPDFTGATGWLNTAAPLTAQGLRGKVVLVDIWTFGCINCQRAIPYVRGWAEKYKAQGLVTIGVHSPEFAFERKADNVKRAAADLKLDFPIALDNDFAIWKAFSNQYWPALYLIDAQGRIRYHHFGEGEYERSEQVIRQLLDEARGGAKTG